MMVVEEKRGKGRNGTRAGISSAGSYCAQTTEGQQNHVKLFWLAAGGIYGVNTVQVDIKYGAKTVSILREYRKANTECNGCTSCRSLSESNYGDIAVR